MKRVSRAFGYVLGLVMLLIGGGTHLASAQGAQSRAGLVVQFGDGSVRSYCIAFEGESITGFDLLLKSGLNVTAEGFGGMGGLVCKIEGEGCDYPGEACVCKSYGPQGVYWSYHHLREGKWKTSSMGAGGYRVRNGEVDGWAWSAGKAPVVRTFDQLCGAAEPKPTDTPVPPTATPRPQPTNTPKPSTDTPQPAKPSSTATARAATSTPVAARPTSTKVPQVVKPSATREVVRQVTATRQPPRVMATSTPKKVITSTSTSMYTSTPVPTRRPIQVTPPPMPLGASPTQVETVAPTVSATQTTVPPTGTNTSIPMPIETVAPTQTSTPIAPVVTNSPTQTPTPNPLPPATDTARTISMVIGAAVIGGLLVWGGVTLATRRVGGKSRSG